MNQFQPILYASLRSPFARRIRLALHRLDIPYQENMVDVFQDNPSLNAANPLGLVPTLVSMNGVITDSTNILEYLNDTYSGIWPNKPHARASARQTSVWAAGIMQSLVLYFQELKMHEEPSARWLKDHLESIETTLACLAIAPQHTWFTDAEKSDGLTQAAWDLCVALEYMSLRVSELDWRSKYPNFLAILEVAKKNSYFCETTPPA